MRLRLLALAAAVVTAAPLAGCDKARTVPPEVAAPVTSCTGCHGGLDNATGAPPRDTAGGSTGVKVGAHTAHVLAGLDCDACHVKPGRVREPGHLDGKVGITFGALAQLPEGSAAPAYDTTLHTCSNVYCHGAKLPTYAQGQATAPGWTASPLPGAPCASCHGSAATFGAPPAPHPGGMAGQEDCNVCHAGTVDGTGALISAAAGGLHINGQKDISASACNACHGDRAGTRGETAGSAALFAPPVDSVGASTGAKVGAHLRHVSTVTALGSRLSQPFPCTECHVVPLTSGPHVQPPAQVVQFGTAAPPARNLSTAGGSLPVFTPGAGAAGGSCATTYCHGGGLGAGGTAHSPSWNAPGSAACGTCHFQASSVASAAGHPQVDKAGDPFSSNAQCNQCHAGTVDPAGDVLVGLGNHVNGSIESTSPHAAGWVAAASHGPAAKRDLASCQPCHGTTFGTLVGAPPRSCNTCHASPATFVPGYTGPTHPTWQTECTFCHGDTNRAAVAGQDSVGTPTVNAGKVAPPVDSEEHTAATDVAVGAHLRHVSSNLLSAPFKCDQCHGVGVLAGTPHRGVDHVDTTVSIGWQLAALGTTPEITPATTPAAIPPPAAGTIPAARSKTGAPRSPDPVVSCANYCHGSTMSGGTATTVFWNQPGTAGCSTCHSLPPSYTAPSWHTAGANAGNCASCHPYATPTSAANRALHVDGTVELNAGVTCNSCHGSAANAAPPGAASSSASTSADPRVGAHQAHLAAGGLARAFLCTDCHGALPAAMNHADGTVTLTWSTLAAAAAVSPSPTAGDKQPGTTSTCANYCHGGKWAPAGTTNDQYRGTLTSPGWTAGPSQVACGACHKVAPTSTAHASVTTATNCSTCHVDYDCTSGNLAACTVNLTTHVNGIADAPVMSCASCHGTAGRTMTAGTLGPSQANANAIVAVPPRDTAGLTTGNKVGPHLAHAVPPVPGAQFYRAVRCSECHGNAVDAYTTSHPNGASEVTFANAAGANLGGITATWTPGSPGTCTTYCHGAALVAGQRGVVATWRWDTATTAACNSCHASPPADAAHTSVSKPSLATACNACHATVVNAAGGIIFNGTGTSATTLHINGARQTSATCRSCHGNATNFAPPTATTGASSGVKVGAHQKHLTGTALRTGALDCNNCHAVPTLQNHASGAVDVAWNTLATASAVTPAPAAGAVVVAWETAPTCTNYCHGGKWAANASYRGATTSVSWTGTAADAACNDCHQAPPASSGHASVTTATNCNSCHSGYTCTSGNLAACTVNRTIHLNGTADLPNLTCSTCHGTAGRTAIAGTFGPAQSTNNLVGMPPVDTGSASSGVKVGGHVSHSTPTPATQVITAVLCSECHGTAVNGYAMGHSNSVSDVTFANATRANLGTGYTPGIAQGTGTTPDTCTTYCHGASLTAAQRGSITTWTWTSTTNANCGSCHGSAPNDPVHTSVSKSALATACNACHATVVNAAGGIIFNGTGTSATTLHINGARQTSATCRSCHGNATNFAPPTATTGASSGVKVGAHQKHLTGTALRTGALDCNNCHAVPTLQNHASGAVDVAWNTLATASAVTPAPAAGAVVVAWETAPTCTNYCHGGKWAANASYRGATTSVSWTGTAADAACNDCHQAPPASSGHASVTTATNCNSCHSGYTCTSGNLAACTVNRTIHLNGTADLPNLTCSTCHGTAGRTAIAGTFGPAQSTNNLVGMPPVDTGSASSGVKVGGHVSHSTPTPATQVITAVLCSECHGTAVNGYAMGHSNSVSDVTFANATRANLGTGYTPGIAQGTGTTPDTCTTYCHGASLTAAQRGSITTWTWTSTTNANCGSCHGSAPNDPVHTSVSKSALATACNACHATVVNAAGGIIFNGTGTSATTLHINGARQTSATCRSCHGNATNFAPPTATTGASSGVKVGAHQKHLTGTALRTGALDCNNCHAVPTLQNHASGAVDVAWNTLAAVGFTPTPVAGAVAAGWETAPTCTNYCHGGKWAANAQYRGATTSVSWTGTAADAACNDCHQAPPASSGHASVTTATNCSSCHSGYTCTSGNLAACTVNRTIHLNGTADLPNLTCSTCHGTAGRTAIAGTFGPAQSTNNLVGMPPVDTGSASSGVRVGGHVSHSTPTPATQVITSVLCSECHGTAVNSYAMGHSNSVSDVTFANATRANLGTGYTPGIAQGTGTTPDTCTTYCHGASLTAAQRGSITTWTWTSTTNANCGSCHGSAPNDPVHTSVSKSALATACNACHATVVNAAGGIIFNGTGTSATTLHINGARQTSATCTSCHGGAVNAAPPVATNGTTATTTPKVGAHQKHLTGTTLRTGALDCSNCHAVPTAMNHATGVVNVAWNTLATASAVTPAPAAGAVAAGWETAPTCTNYCHGGKWAANAQYRGATTSVSWTGTPADAQCNDCHQAPPVSGVHGSVTTATNCNSCHDGYNCTSGNLAACTVNKTVHLNGVGVLLTDGCSSCHGTAGRTAIAGTFGPAQSTNNLIGMPPVDTASASSGVRVGGHVSHSTPTPATQVITSVLCSECHGTAVNSYAMGHSNSVSDVTFANATRANLGTGYTPGIAQGTGTTPDTCTTYCHGASLTAQQRGSITTWTWTSTTNANCGSCHGSAPNDPVHTSVSKSALATACNACHATVVNAAGGIIFNGTGTSATTLHINGARQTSATCTSCHGGAVNAAPPVATNGTTATTAPKVGAHQKHLTGTTLRTGALDCNNCHAVPTAMNHATGAVNVTWNTLASVGFTPTPAAGAVAAGWETAPTCTNYCHGGKWAANATYRGATTSVSWTGTAADAACNDCHLAPPTSGGHASVTTATNCNTCHSGYTCTSGNLAACTVNRAIHLNGTANLPVMACSSCHGAAGRTAIAGTFGPAQSANNLVGMPPIDTAAASSGVKVGGHVSHSTPTPATQVITAVLCSECHGNAVNGYASNHSNSVSDVTFANATRANLGTGYTPGIAQGTGTTPDTCTTYCHGASLTAQQRGSITTWTWTSTTNANCGSCHGSAPNDPVHTSVSKSALATACNACHATVVNTSGNIIFNGTGTSATTLHINGARQTSATCRSCHGNATNFAPPTATNGTTATTTPKVGAHQKHLTGTTLRTGALDCNNCHTVPTLQNHATGAVNVAWNTLASVGFTPTPAAGAVAVAWETAPTCTNYCHGGKWAANASYRGATTSVSWTGTPADAACNDCHQAPPASAGHSSVTTATSCSTCHSGYTCTSGNLAACTVNRTIHLNGTFEAPAGGDCTGCHASAQGARRAIVSEFAGAWSHKRSATPAGTVTKFDCVVCHMEGTLTTGDVDSAYHLGVAGGPINLRDPDTGLHIKTVTWGGTNAGAYTSSTTDATFVQFSRNLSSNVLEAPVTAIMINQCLKCHDANGAQVGYVRGPTAGSSAKPFNTTIAGATYTGAGVTAGGVLGGVIDVAASFATANSSYHPISGKQNNSYVSALRMNAPWNVLTKTGGNTTSWGYLISCWDCHAPLNATGVQTATITAHGGTRTTRRDYWITNATNLCTACHQVVPATGATNNSHGAGSAFSGGGNSGPGGIARTACWRCHGSTASAKPSRPYSSQDVHGFNALSPALGTDTLWPVGATNTYRPFGFMRSAGASGTWLTTSWKPLSGPSVPTGSATCGGTAALGGASCSSRNHGAYTPGGVY